MRRLLIELARAAIALIAAYLTKLLNEAADAEVTTVQKKGEEVTRHNELIDSVKTYLANLEAEAEAKVEAYINAHVASTDTVKTLRAEAERFAALS